MRTTEKCAHLKTTISQLFHGGNMAAGLASGLHVNLYICGLAMVLSNSYYSIKPCLVLATISTIIIQ
eukprot:SAG22_NODE_17653_length_301_cov_0.559406_1_plen_66_part_10